MLHDFVIICQYEILYYKVDVCIAMVVGFDVTVTGAYCSFHACVVFDFGFCVIIHICVTFWFCTGVRYTL